MFADYEIERERMVREQIERRGITSERVLAAMRQIPRHCFVPVENRHLAYADCPQGIGFEQTISQPYIVALMSSLLGLKGEERVLEIGSGSGYQAAVLACLAKEVYSIERIPPLSQQARQTLAELKIPNVSFHVGDGSLGLPEFAPYQGILLTAAPPCVPDALLGQLAENGRLVAPVGPRLSQDLQVWQRLGDHFEMESLIPVAFVPLIGEQGWH